MKLVIADDFTGSAELAGIGLRFGLKQEIRRTADLPTHLDLAIWDTDTRARSAVEIEKIMQPFLEKVKSHSMNLYYKKTDSVLRGHVLKELKLLIEYLKIPRILLIPANPSRNRIIRNGIFFINGQPLHKTDFANGFMGNLYDGQVLKILGKSKTVPVNLIKPGDKLPERGIIVGETQTKDDLKFWAKILDTETLPAGGAEFFETLLAMHFKQLVTTNANGKFSLHNKKMFFVLASTSQYSRNFVQQMVNSGWTICFFPKKLSDASAFQTSVLNQWLECAQNTFKKHQRVAIAIGQKVIRDRTVSRKLSRFIAKVVLEIIPTIDPDILLIEGGSTAAAIFNLLNLTRFIPEQELSPGVVQLKSPQLSRNTRLIVKPGSYEWPNVIRQVVINE